MSRETRIHRRTRLSTLVATVATVAMAGTAVDARADGLKWTIAPYLWASDVGVDLKVNDEPLLGNTAEFSDLVDKLETAFMAHVEASGERFGGYFDMIYIDLSDSNTVSLGPGEPILGGVSVDVDLGLEIYELGGFYRFPATDSNGVNFDLLLGARLIEADLAPDITLPGPGDGVLSPRIENSETDIVAGARAIGRFSGRWGYKARADYGFGGSEGALNLLATVGYTFGESELFTLDLGYRYFDVEFKNSLGDGSSTTSEITMSGPVLGFIFQF